MRRREEREKSLNDHYHACGCNAGAAALLLALGHSARDSFEALRAEGDLEPR